MAIHASPPPEAHDQPLSGSLLGRHRVDIARDLLAREHPIHPGRGAAVIRDPRAAVEPGGAGAKGLPGAAVPVGLIVPAAVAWTGEVRDLVMLVAPRIQPFDRGLKHCPFEILRHRFERAAAAARLKRRPLLPGETVDRHVLRTECDRGGQVPFDGRERLARRGGHEIEAHDQARLVKKPHRPAHVIGHVVSVERAERGCVERLPAQAHPRGPAVSRGGHELCGHIERVGLDRHLSPGHGQEPFVEDREQPPQTVWPEVRWRTAAEIERVECERLLHPAKFHGERRHIPLHEVVPPGHECEVAIPAPMPAEGHVHIGVSRLHGSQPTASQSGAGHPGSVYLGRHGRSGTRGGVRSRSPRARARGFYAGDG